MRSAVDIGDRSSSGLVIELFLFLGVEVIMPTYKPLRKKYRYEESFRLTVNRGLQAGMMRRVVGEAASSPPEATIMATSRVNSGFALQEGLVSRRGTMATTPSREGL